MKTTIPRLERIDGLRRMVYRNPSAYAGLTDSEASAVIHLWLRQFRDGVSIPEFPHAPKQLRGEWHVDPETAIVAVGGCRLGVDPDVLLACEQREALLAINAVLGEK